MSKYILILFLFFDIQTGHMWSELNDSDVTNREEGWKVWTSLRSGDKDVCKLTSLLYRGTVTVCIHYTSKKHQKGFNRTSINGFNDSWSFPVISPGPFGLVVVICSVWSPNPVSQSSIYLVGFRYSLIRSTQTFMWDSNKGNKDLRINHMCIWYESS